MTGILMRKGEKVQDRGTKRDDITGMTEAKTGVMLRPANEHQGLLVNTRSRKMQGLILPYRCKETDGPVDTSVSDFSFLEP